MRTATVRDTAEVRDIAKKHGIEHCRLANTGTIYVGRQTIPIDPEVAQAFLLDINAAGFVCLPGHAQGPRYDVFVLYVAGYKVAA